MIRIGIDVGGTFTDLTLLNGNQAIHHKTPSTPEEPARAIEKGLQEIMELAAAKPEEVSWIGHGTTVATNMAIERTGAKTALVTTKGFRDVLEIGRQTRPNLYDYRITRPPPLAARRYRIEVAERLNEEGSVLIPLDKTAVEDASSSFSKAGIEAVAVVFLHSYRNPTHEKHAVDILKRLLPHAFISCSVEVSPEFREFERTSTTVLNAFVGPRMSSYFKDFRRRITDLGIKVEPYIVHSGGGLMTLQTAEHIPVRTCLSGPAAGVAAAATIALKAGFPNVATFDVGGTSTDIALITNGTIRIAAEREVAGYPVRTPSLDIAVIGAGGGSLAQVDDAGGLTVGPKSSGANPGPAAYGLGGKGATLTDANLILGRLDPNSGLVEGTTKLDLEAAESALSENVAIPLDITLEKAAAGVLAVATANIARAIRSATSERGHDLREMALVAYGGAGPLLAADVAHECGCPVVIIPPAPGTLCARGILMSDPTTDFVETVLAPADDNGWESTETAFSRMTKSAKGWLNNQTPDQTRHKISRIIEARYLGQGFEAATETREGDTLSEFIERFHKTHHTEHGYEIRSRKVEIVNCRVIATATGFKSNPSHLNKSGFSNYSTETRKVCFDGQTRTDTSIYERSKIGPGTDIIGPAIVTEKTATTVIPPAWRAEVDAYGNLILRVMNSNFSLNR
jgi:N-methylhydantoinase A